MKNRTCNRIGQSTVIFNFGSYGHLLDRIKTELNKQAEKIELGFLNQLENFFAKWW